MASILNVDTISGKTPVFQLTVNVGAATQHIQAGLSKMFAAFDGGAASMFDSLNVTSETDTGPGDYTFNFTNNFSGANVYASPMSVALTDSAKPGSYTNGQTASSVRVLPTRGTSGTNADVGYLSIACIGDLA